MCSTSKARVGARLTFLIVLLLFTAQLAAAPADDYVAKARAHLADNEVRAAVIQLKNALQADPAHVQARLLLGTLQLQGNDAAAAVKEFGRARDLGAPKKDWVLGYMRALTSLGETRTLLDEVQDDAGLAPAVRAELLALRGNALLVGGQAEAAEAEFARALEQDPRQPLATLGRIQLQLARGDEDAAMAGLDRLIADHPAQVDSLLLRGDLHRRHQRLDAAAADYRRAAEAAPNNPRPHIGLALVSIAQRDLAAARKSLAALDRLTRDLPVLNYLKALVAFQEQDFDRASDELQTLLRVAPSSLQAQLLYGIVSYAREEFTIADDYLTRVFASVPGNLQVVKLLGATRLKLRQPERAVQVLAGAVDQDTRDAQLLALLGTAYLQTGDNTRGSELIERAVEIDPDQAMLRTQLAVGRIASGDTAGAITELESAVALGQDVIQADVLLVLGYLNKQQYDKAVAASEALEQRMSDSPIPYNLTGLALLAQRQFEPARARFEQALEKDPGFLVARMNLARLALAEQKPEAARAAYDAVLKQDPNHLGAMLGMAGLARARGDEAETERWLLRANQANPKSLQPVLVLAEGYLRRNEGLKAKNLLAGLSPEQAGLPAVLRLRGMAQLQSGEYANAVHVLRQLTEKEPASVESWFQLARAQAAAGDTAAARASFRRGIELDPEHRIALIRIGLAELELRERNHDAALVLAREILTRFPDNVSGYDIEAAAYRGKGETEAALAAAEKALQLDPGTRRVNALAGQLAAAGQSDRATTLLRDWLAANPDDAGGWANLGMLEQQAGRESEALSAYERAIERVDDNAVILNNMAWLYLSRDPQRARALATRAYELAPTRAEIVDTYGWVLFKTGRRPEGLAALQQALVIAPRNAEIALHVAEALIAMDRAAEARPILQRVLRDSPGTDFARSATAMLGRIGG